ncbi:MAG: kelch repeat-containing protein, partial [Chloroflexota bacterium]
GAYVIQSLVGRGGMGVVYVAEHTALRRRVALKVIAPEVAEDLAFRDRFMREARLAASLHHPNIIEIYDAGQVGDELYLAMRYVDGASLARVIGLAGRLQPDRALSILAMVASALDEAHANGLIHRDVKPDNILIGAPASRRTSEEVFLTDFGLVRRIDARSRLTRTGSVLGSLSYLAPEVLQSGVIDGRSDQYSLACVLYECLTGKVPFRRDMDAALLMAHLTSPPPSVTDEVSDVSGRLDAVIARGMAKDKEERYPSCTELIEDARVALREFVQATQTLGEVTEVVGRSSTGSPEARPIHGPRVRSLGFARAAVAALAIVAVSAALAVALPLALRTGSATPTADPAQGGRSASQPGSVAVPSGSSRSAGTSPGSIPEGGTWLRTGTLNDARWGHGATLLASGQVLVVGGNASKNSSSALASAELFDPASGRWTPTASMSKPRAYPSVTVLRDGTVLVAGGAFDNAPLALAERYDPVSGRWSPVSQMNVLRLHHTATLLDDGRVLVVGGGTSTTNKASTATAEIYDPASRKWTRTASMATARSYHTATLLEDGRVLVVGGRATYVGGGTVLASAEIFDPRTGRWSAAAAMPTRRYVHAAVRLGDGRILVAGGWSSTVLDARSLQSAAIFDPKTGEWAPEGDMTTGRAQFAMASLPDGRVLAVGGFSPEAAPQASAELLDPLSGPWSPTGTMSDSSWWPTLDVLPDGRALVAGGASDKSGAVPLAFAELYAPPSR